MVHKYQPLITSINELFSPFLAALFVVSLVMPLVIILARKFKVLDYPNERKIHNRPVPRLGGLGIVVGFWTVSLFFAPANNQFYAILTAGTFIAFLGMIDDIRGLSSRIRLLGQILASLVVIHAGLLVSFLPKTPAGQLFAALITIFWIVGIVNAMNFADGLDGLAAGITFIASIFFFLLAVYLQQQNVALMAVILAGSCLGFLLYNFRPAKIYLGDGGSTFLGFIIACTALYGGWSDDGFVVALGIPTIILGVLIFDMIYITLARIRSGHVKTFQEWLDYTGKDHFHHRLMSLGFSEVAAVLFIYLVCIILGLNVLVLEKIGNPLGVSIIFINSSLIFIAIFILMRVGHAIKENKSE